MPLISAKPKLEAEIKQHTYEAAKEAFLTSLVDNDSSATIQNKIKQEMEGAAHRFAQKFSEELSGPLAESIYKFTKDIGIMAIPKGTLISASPGMPVTGTINIGDFVIT